MQQEAIDRKLENINTLRAYFSLIREPVSSKNCGKYKKMQDQRLQTLMRKAYDIPFYSERFERSGTGPEDYTCAEDLYKFPLLTKDELREWMDGEAKKDPERFSVWHVSPTSGSTGRPLRCLISPAENAWMTANWLRVMTMAGFDPFRGKTMSRPNSLHGPVKETDSPIQKLGILRRRYMSDTIRQRIDTQTLVDEINAYQPGYLYNHKNLLMRIALYVKENGIDLWKPQFFTPFGEMLDDPSRALLTEVFGPGLVDAYGMGEIGSCVTRLPGKPYYQVNSDLFVVNIYNAALDGPADKGMAVITPLFKTQMPLINYTSFDRMDTVIRHGLRFVKGVQGRMNDVIHHRDGSVTEWGNISGIVNYMPQVVQYRIIQEDYENLSMLLVRNPDTPPEEQEEITAQLDEKLKAMFKDPSFKISYTWVDQLPDDPNGKLRVIISKVRPGALGEPENAGTDVGSAKITT